MLQANQVQNQCLMYHFVNNLYLGVFLHNNKRTILQKNYNVFNHKFDIFLLNNLGKISYICIFLKYAEISRILMYSS